MAKFWLTLLSLFFKSICSTFWVQMNYSGDVKFSIVKSKFLYENHHSWWACSLQNWEHEVLWAPIHLILEVNLLAHYNTYYINAFMQSHMNKCVLKMRVVQVHWHWGIIYTIESIHTDNSPCHAFPYKQMSLALNTFYYCHQNNSHSFMHILVLLCKWALGMAV